MTVEFKVCIVNKGIYLLQSSFRFNVIIISDFLGKNGRVWEDYEEKSTCF